VSEAPGGTEAEAGPIVPNTGPPPGHARGATQGEASALPPGTIVLDARGPDDFDRGHLAGAARISHEEFRDRRAELPPRTATILVVHDEPAEARRAATTLALLGYRDVRWLEGPLAALAGGHAATGAPARAWRPSPFLERVRPELPGGRALDLAAGSGRDGVFLALHGWRAEAWDHDAGALARARALAAGAGVALETRVVELVEAAPPELEAAWDVIVVVRFLHRPLMPWIERALAPGGALVYETFRTGQERYGRPKNPRFLLEPGELRTAFPTLEVEHYEEDEPEGGPILARLLARRPR
jgi:rhodanese-related sulfurtransferase